MAFFLGTLRLRRCRAQASFYAWRRRLLATRVSTASSSLVPVRIVTDGKDGGQITVELAERRSAAATLRVVVGPDCDEASIRRVLRAVLSEREQDTVAC